MKSMPVYMTDKVIVQEVCPNKVKIFLEKISPTLSYPYIWINRKCKSYGKLLEAMEKKGMTERQLEQTPVPFSIGNFKFYLFVEKSEEKTWVRVQFI